MKVAIRPWPCVAVVCLQVGDRTLDGWHMFGGNPRHDGPVAPPPPRGV